MKKLRLLGLFLFVSIQGCQVYVQTIPTKSKIEKLDIDYNKI